MNTTKQTSTMTQNASAATHILTSSETSHHHRSIIVSEEKRKSCKILKHKKRKKKIPHHNLSTDQCVETQYISTSIPGVLDKFEDREYEVEKLPNMCIGSQTNITSLSQRRPSREECCFDLGFHIYEIPEKLHVA